MSLKLAQVATLVAATVTTGLMAGVFGLYAHAIMRGLGETDDRTFVGAFQAIDRAIMNPLFMLWFMGALLFTGGAALLYLRDGRSVLPWVVAAFALYLVVFVITMVVHVPLNDGLKAAGNPDRIADLATVRDDFHEDRWVAWNVVRAVATAAAFGCLVWGLVLHGRLTSDPSSTGSAGSPTVNAGSVHQSPGAAGPAGWTVTEAAGRAASEPPPASVGADPSQSAGG